MTLFYPSAVHYGGPGGAIYTWIVASVFHLCVSFSLAEICSAWPSSGGLYYWSAKLGGRRHGPILSWFTAYMNLVGEISSIAGYAFGLSLIIFSCIAFYVPGYECSPWQPGLLAIVFVVLWGIINSTNDIVLARTMELAIASQVLGSIAVIVILLTCAPVRKSASFIFTTFEPQTHHHHSPLYSGFISVTFPSWVWIGYDSSAHISEETVNAYKGVSKSLIYSILLNSVLGFLLIVALSLTTQSLNLFQDENLFIYTPVMSFHDATQSETVALILTSLVALALFFGGLSVNTVNSRMIFAFARDDGFGRYVSSKLRYMHAKTRVPLHALWTSSCLTIVILVLSFGLPSGGQQGAISFATASLLSAYTLPIFAKVAIKSREYMPGEFSLGSLSTFIGWTSVVWVSFIIVVLCFPSEFPLTLENFNYSSILLAVVLLIISAVWIISARHWYTGPIRRIDEYDVARMERSIIAAKDALAEIGALSAVTLGDGVASYARMS
ncbi:amino acid transporter [Gonapodya prolifera JEL478]|uniref:Amino acid transporter n=1 Tax=Gonapodya prolifera (strain JEL478) TaxID=1344416 RepID=A0A139ACY9_GONPJ|nr:amino acid transporter [Gonapodya prolifera JEL478]|eukprot:KXS14618.1 amino acid transporter [Gonapodya prolifera JEL478]